MLDSGLALVFREVFLPFFFFFTHPTEPEEGLKIDESSQNQFIALEIFACVMSGKTVLPFCLTEVAVAATAPECLTIKVGLFILCFFFFLLPPLFSLHSVQGELRAAYSYVKCDEILLVTVRGAFTFPWTHALPAQL